MPSPPGSHPSRQITVRLPWHVWARLQALAAADPHGARTGRVAAAALDRGVEVLERAAAGRGPAGAGDAPGGHVGPVWQPPPNDPRWALDAVGKPYAREPHTVGAMGRNGKRVEVAVAAGDTAGVVGRALEAAAR